jgi:hypothetical protein
MRSDLVRILPQQPTNATAAEHEGVSGQAVPSLANDEADDSVALSGWSAFQLGDALTVTGLVECCRGRLSIHTRLLSVEESWSALFGVGARYYDAPPPEALCGVAKSGRGTAMVQSAGSHAVRLQEYLEAVLSTPALAIVPPVPGASGREVRRDERCLLLGTEDAAALCEAVTADPQASRVVQRWYVLGHQANTFQAAVTGLRELLRAKGASASRPLSVRVHGYPKALEAKLVEALRRGGEVELRPRCEVLVSAVYSFGYFAFGLGDGSRFQGEIDAGRTTQNLRRKT